VRQYPHKSRDTLARMAETQCVARKVAQAKLEYIKRVLLAKTSRRAGGNL
jgi:hypothetical protein